MLTELTFPDRSGHTGLVLIARMLAALLGQDYFGIKNFDNGWSIILEDQGEIIEIPLQADTPLAAIGMCREIIAAVVVGQVLAGIGRYVPPASFKLRRSARITTRPVAGYTIQRGSRRVHYYSHITPATSKRLRAVLNMHGWIGFTLGGLFLHQVWSAGTGDYLVVKQKSERS
jgi:hypothetical protein